MALDRLRQCLVLLAFIVASVGCDINMQPLPCECPELEKAVDTINWAPDLSFDRDSSGSARVSYLEVARIYRGEGANPAELVDRVVVALVVAGFDVLFNDFDYFEATKGPIKVSVSEMRQDNDSSELPGVRIAVIAESSRDGGFAEELDPLREALSDA